MNAKKCISVVLAMITFLFSITACGKNTPAEEFAKAIYAEKFEHMQNGKIVILDKNEEHADYVSNEKIGLGQSLNGTALTLLWNKELYDGTTACTCDNNEHKNGISLSYHLKLSWYLKPNKTQDDAPCIDGDLTYSRKICGEPTASFTYSFTIKNPEKFIAAVAQGRDDLATDFANDITIKEPAADVENRNDKPANVAIFFDIIEDGIEHMLETGKKNGYDLTVTEAE